MRLAAKSCELTAPPRPRPVDGGGRTATALATPARKLALHSPLKTPHLLRAINPSSQSCCTIIKIYGKTQSTQAIKSTNFETLIVRRVYQHGRLLLLLLPRGAEQRPVEKQASMERPQRRGGRPLPRRAAPRRDNRQPGVHRTPIRARYL